MHYGQTGKDRAIADKLMVIVMKIVIRRAFTKFFIQLGIYQLYYQVTHH